MWSSSAVSYRSWCRTAACGRRGLMPAFSAGSGSPTASPNAATVCAGRASSAATCSGWLRTAPTKTVPRPSDAAATTAFWAASAVSMKPVRVVSRWGVLGGGHDGGELVVADLGGQEAAHGAVSQLHGEAVVDDAEGRGRV